MMDETEDDPELDRALGGLARQQAPPSGLEGRVVAALRTRGLLAGGARRPWAAAALAAGLAAAFAAGWLVRPLATAPRDEPAFLLLLEGGAVGAGESARESVEAHLEWARQLVAEGRLIRAEKLSGDAVRLEGPAGRRAPAAAGPDGFFLLRARDLDEAVALARGCPTLREGGRVTVRPVDPT